jgi:hypothetical protein
MKINKDIKQLEKNIEAHLGSFIEQGSKENRKEIFESINGNLNYWKTQEVWKYLNINGYSYPSVCRKLNDKSKISRKIRSDKNKIRNPILNIYWEEIEECTSLLYFENKGPSLEKLRELILNKLNQGNGELSKVPIGTFKKQLKKLLEKSNQESVEIGSYKKLETEQKVYFAGWNTKKELAKFIMIANQESDSKKKAEKYLKLIKIKV